VSLDTHSPHAPDKVWLHRRWLTQQEAADYLSVTDRTVRNLISRGDLRGHRIKGSRMVRIDRHELEQLLRPIPTAGAL
jgi:excisionase family DNA binding protein